MSEYTHYFAIPSDDLAAVKAVLGRNKIVSIVTRGDRYPDEPAWDSLPIDRRWIVLHVHRPMRTNAQGQYYFDDPWETLPGLFDRIVELWVDELDLRQAGWQLKLAESGACLLDLDNTSVRTWPAADLETLARFFRCPIATFEQHLAPGRSVEFCRSTGLPFHHLMAEATFPNRRVDWIAAQGYAIDSDQLDD